MENHSFQMAKIYESAKNKIKLRKNLVAYVDCWQSSLFRQGVWGEAARLTIAWIQFWISTRFHVSARKFVTLPRPAQSSLVPHSTTTLNGRSWKWAWSFASYAACSRCCLWFCSPSWSIIQTMLRRRTSARVPPEPLSTPLPKRFPWTISQFTIQVRAMFILFSILDIKSACWFLSFLFVWCVLTDRPLSKQSVHSVLLINSRNI